MDRSYGFKPNPNCLLLVCRYHVPRSWIKPSGNTLVLLEEMGGDPTKISFATKQTGSSLCLTVSQSHPAPVDSWASDSKILNRTSPVLSLKCPVSTHVITSINFASFGTPTGTCGSFSHGRCNSPRSLSIVRKVLNIVFSLLFFPSSFTHKLIYIWSL